MTQLVWAKVKDRLDSSMKKKAWTFMEKLAEDDTLPGLHIEPIKGAVDSRVRTGRVDDNFRCVLFKLTGAEEAVYVFYGIWPHDKANQIAESVRLKRNAITLVPEVERVVPLPEPEPPLPPQPEPSPPDGSETETPPEDDEEETDPSPAWPGGTTAERLHTELGIDRGLAEQALALSTESELLELAANAPVQWQGEALVEIATGTPIEEVRRGLRLDQTFDVGEGTEDEQLLASLHHPAASSSFHWIEDDEDLRRVIEQGDLAAWRLFLHPEQQRYVDGDYNGPFRLSGGAGTGKTVVALHRTRRLAKQEPQARILLTTFTVNLAGDLESGLRQLDDSLTLQRKLGQPGIQVKGIDQVAWSVLQSAGDDVAEAAARVLGDSRTSVLTVTKDEVWKEAIAEADADLPPELANLAFLQSEYALVVLPNRITTATQYVRVRRSGRGVALDRARRLEVWKVIERYRALGRVADSVDFQERAAIAAEWLELRNNPQFDHVVIDEAQDLSPSQLRFVRALAAQGSNDLFLCEDSHQRIYGHKIVLSHVGIQVRGRSRRLRLNYRTTAQNLRWAMGILEGGDYSDLEGEPEKHDYHSVRSGPVPNMMPADRTATELDNAADLIKSWLPTDEEADGRAAAPENIAVLVRDQYRRETVVSGLQERGLQVRSVDRGSAKPGMPLVMTMHRAKGLEFTHVLLFGIHEGAVPRALKDYEFSEQDHEDALLRERSLVYVAATRARDVLAVSWSGVKSPMIG